MNKLVKIEMTFEDGKVQVLSGESAQKWIEACNGATTLAYVHGFSFPAFEWSEIKNEGKSKKRKVKPKARRRSS